MSKGKKFLSDLKLYTDYLKWDETKGRYENWNEACEDVLNTHILKYGDKVKPYINEVLPSYQNKEFLTSQRNLQFRGESLMKHNSKIYNCCVAYAYSPDLFSKSIYVLLCGTGLGVSLKNKFIKQLPSLDKRMNGVKSYQIPDSIEGWAEAIKVLISSYNLHPSLYEEYYGYEIKFDYSLIRPKGAMITGGFKAPGHEGLKQSLERIEKLIEDYLGDNLSKKYNSLTVYDILMHLSDAVLSGGVRRSAMSVIIDQDDEDMVNAKTGNWYETNPQRARSNNSVGLIKGEFTKEEFEELVKLNQGDNDIGFVFMENDNIIKNPCFEIDFSFYEEIKDKRETVLQFCNLTEINASACVDSKGEFSEKKFYELCRNASIVGTLQAGYTNFPYLGKQTENIVKGEALLGVSITGWMARPELFNEEILKKGAQIVLDTNEEVANVIGINLSARATTVKPSGNASTVLMTPSGIHPEHSQRMFRLMQLNKSSENAKYLEEVKPEMLEESTWSSTNTDYVVYVPIENSPDTLFKSEMQGVKHLELIKLVQNSWVSEGKREELCYDPSTNHNVSNTVIIDDMDEIIDYLYENQEYFTAVSFISLLGDKDYKQAPNTSVLNTEEIVKEYGEGSIFVSGLIVDGLQYFNGDLWEATNHALNKELKFVGTRTEVLLKKDWVRRVKKFSRNYFKNDLEKTVYCIKDVHLWHKWNVINRGFKSVDFGEILTKPTYIDVDTMGAVACSGMQCEI